MMQLRSVLFKDVIEYMGSGRFFDAQKILSELSVLDLNGHSLELLKNLKARHNKAVLQSSPICGIYDSYPSLIDGRVYEGGKRLLSQCDSRFSSSESPLVTIITVVFNNVETVATCIESVLNQTYKNIEYIIIDGASEDGTLAQVLKYENHLDYILSEPDNGIYNAMNKGLCLAKGDFIAFLNADDYYLSDAVEQSVNNLIKNNLDLSYAGFYYADENNVIVVADEAKPWCEAMLVEGIPGGHETLFLKKECYDYLKGYDESYRLAADYHLFVRCFFANFKAAPLQKNILVMTPGGTSFNKEMGLDENRRVMEFCFGELSNEFFEFLYGLKYYNNWHGYPINDKAIEHYLLEASKRSALFNKAVFLSIENRKREIRGRILPAIKDKGDKLSICIVLNYLTNASGGAERIAVESANKLYEEGHAVTFVQCFGVAGEPYYQLNPAIPLIDLAVSPYKVQYLMPADEIDISFERFGGRGYEKLEFYPTEQDFDQWRNSPHFWRSQVYSGFFYHHKFDVVISHMPSTYPYTLLPRKLGDNVLHIASLHNSPEFKFYSPLYPAESQMERYMRLVALDHADRIGVLFDEFIGQVPEEFQHKCFVLPNFLSKEIAAVASEMPKNTVEKDKKTILSVGRLSDQKDHQTLIRAYALIRDSLPEWNLKIYGEGPLLGKLSACCVEAGLNPDEILMGARKDIYNIYPLGDVFAFPSLFEGFGLTALEAMSFGLPVIAFRNCEGVKNLIGDGKSGLLISPESRIESMAEALLKLCDNESLRIALAQEARMSARAYSLQNYINVLSNEVARHYSVTETASLLPVFPLRKSVRYAILTTYTEGGAGIAAVRLAKALRGKGVNVSVISFSMRDTNFDYKLELQQEQQELYELSLDLNKNYTSSGSTFFSNQLYPSLTRKQVDFLRHYDVINLHWVQMLLSIEVIEYILSFGKKVIWTLHDMAPFTGGCHYSNGCVGYTNDCSNCPQLSDAKKGFPKLVLEEKIKRWTSKNLIVVSPSKWLADCAEQSQVFRNVDVRYIPNGLDTKVFVPTGKWHARNFFGLPQDKKILLFTCQSHAERRKGFKELVETTKLLSEQRDDLHIVTFGHASDGLKSLPIPVTALGHINEEWKLAVGYSAADVTVLPSLEDNLPNVILESFACNTPVATFDLGGCGEIILAGITGAVCEGRNCVELSRGILDLIDQAPNDNCRKFSEKYLSLDVFAYNYNKMACHELYTR